MSRSNRACRWVHCALWAVMLTATGPIAKSSISPGEAFRQGDFEKSIKLLKPQAEAGIVSAQIMLGQMYLKGQGVKADPEKGISWIRKAADQGSPVAAYDLGLMELDGVTGTRDLRQAAQWFRKSAHQRYAGAAYNLAVLYHAGTGLEKNDVLALSWIEAATDYLPALTSPDMRARFDEQRVKILQGMSPEQVQTAAHLVSADGPMIPITIKNGEALSKLATKSYPKNLRSLAREGTVVVLVLVHADGSVGDTVVENSSGYPEIDSVTVNLLKSAEIEPRRIQGVPIESWQLMKSTWHANAEPWNSFHNLNKMPLPR